MGDGHGHVAVLTRISGTGPDGRTFDDTQILTSHLTTVTSEPSTSSTATPPAVTAFWA
jgi:hypothetical protein